MAGIDRIHGTVENPASFVSGYSMTFFKIAASGVTLAADTVSTTTNAITDGNFTIAVRTIQNVASLAYLGARANAQFVVAVDGATAQPTGPAFNTDATPTVAERLKIDLEAALAGSTFTITDVSALTTGQI